ncbi:macrolide ABC transporter ATP-binding protein [Candidatus Dependentiae bacterium]|nr:MAG: macrolide ABC transporter ATP-binding protein [Candidatus Dependentiae bacterium]
MNNLLTKESIRLYTDNLKKTYIMGENRIEALKGISFEVKNGEFIAITGTSGSGKSTLMHLLGCLDVPTSGDYFIDGENVATMNRNELATIRNRKIGFIFQKFHLLADLNAIDNVALPQLYAKKAETEAREKALQTLKIVQLENRADHFPFQLSGGQQQRVAIARALINDPTILLADEPTGNLDTTTGEAIMNIFRRLNRERKTTIILVTHEPEIAAQADRVIDLRDGTIKSDNRI